MMARLFAAQNRARLSLALLISGALLVALLIARVGEIANAQQPINQPIIARVTIATRPELERFVALGLDLLEMREGDDFFIMTTRAELEQLRVAGWTIKLDEQQTALLNPLKLETFMGGYRTVTETRAILDNEAALYPTLTQVFTYGTSWQGRDLFGIKLTNNPSTTLRTSLTNPTNKPTFFLMAAIHARELSTAELALRLVDYLLSHYGIDGDATWLLDEHQIVVVPIANPDGRLLAEQGQTQRKNTNTSYGGNCAAPATEFNQIGVDLNRNSSFKWGVVNSPSQYTCTLTYPGPSATSEPETVALQNLVRSFFPDQRGPNDGDAAPITTTGILLTLHSYGNLVLWPWGWTTSAAPNSAGLARIGQKFAAYNGYTPEQSIALYPTSGSTDDWAYGELGMPAFTFEVGPSFGTCGGFFPPFSCLDSDLNGMFWPRNLPAFLYAARIARAPYQLAQGPTTEAITATLVPSNQVELRAPLDCSSNGGQNIVAAEYYMDTPPWRAGIANPMSALDGAFNSANEVAAATVGPLVGRHLVFVRGQDASGNWGPVRAVWVFAPAQTLWFPFMAR